MRAHVLEMGELPMWKWIKDSPMFPLILMVLAVIAMWFVGGCSAQPELISREKQACYDERNRIRREIFEAEKELGGRARVYRRVPRCGRIK